MKSVTQCLQPADIKALLSGTVPASQNELWEMHFSSCESCRIAMAGQVGDQEWWREAEHSLMNASIPEERDAVKSEADERESIEELLKLLGPTDDPQMLGRIGSYEVLGVLGRGGMGVVFKAFDAPLNRFVAIKMLLPHLAASGAARKRFAREGQAVAAVVDDHVMAIHCVDEWQGVPYLVMTYSRGVSLQKRLSDNGPLEVREILRIGIQAAKGLAAAHAQGIVHRDIKPANIFLDQNVERVQLMDFGLARAVDDASLTRSGTLAGTPQYMSPEQARAETVDHRSDLFSLGSVMYAMCTSHAPFRAESSYSVLRLITDKEPRPIREVNPDVPEWLCVIIGKLMAKEASDRFASAQEVAKLLEDCLAHVQQPTIAALPDGLVDRSVPRAFSFRSRTIGVFAMFAVVCSIIVAMLLMQIPDKPNQDGVRDAGGMQVALTNPADARDAGMANLAELLEMQKLREKSLRQIRLLGNIRQTQQIDTKRIEGESNEEYIKRYTSPERIFDGLGPFPMLIERDYNAVSGHIKYGDLNGKLPIMFREWFFKGDVFTQLMGVEDGHGQATITKKPADELRQPWSGWIRADVYAFRPILDYELSTVLEKAAHTPGIPDPAGRPLFHLDKKKSADQKVQWIATFLHQEPSEVNGRTAVEQLWYRVFWEQVDQELLITRVDELSVVGGAESMPLRVALVDDYRKIDGVTIPHRVRTFMFANPSGMLGAEFVASEVKVNDAVAMPRQLQIPPGTSVTDELTGKKYRQPVDEPKSRQDSPKAPIGSSENTTINPDIPAEGKPIDKDALLNELRERDAKFSLHSVELERTWDTLTSPRSEASQYRHNSLRFGQPDPGIPEGLPEDYQQPHRIRYIWTGQNFESTLEILADLETPIHPEHGKLESRSIESDCFNYYRYWNRDLEIFSHSSDIARLRGSKKAWEFLLPSGFGFTHSILSVSNAVEVDNGYVLKGLINLSSATIGSRKNCFEIHLDKELILRKAVIQYHVYDFVIMTTGRSEFEGMPPLAKHAAVSIHYVGQDEKRFGDVGNYKYELIALSEELSKEEYDLRVNFAIPKGTKLSAGLNLVDVNLNGLPGVTQIERDAPAPRPEVTPRDSREIENDQAANQSSRTFTPSDLTAKGDYLVENQKSIRVRFLVKSAKRQTKLLREPWILSTKKDEGDSNQSKEILVVVSPEAEEAFKTTGVDDLRAHLLNKEIEVKGLLTKGGGLQTFGRGAINQHYFININTIEQIRVIEANPAGMDHGNARSVVEAYIAAALAGDVAKAATLAKNSPGDPKRIAEIPKLLNVQRLKIQTVYVDDPAKPTRALATSQSVKLEEEHKQPNGQRDGFMVFTLELTDGKWFVNDIDFESEAGAEKELKRFLEANPNSIGLPPLTSN